PVFCAFSVARVLSHGPKAKRCEDTLPPCLISPFSLPLSVSVSPFPTPQVACRRRKDRHLGVFRYRLAIHRNAECRTNLFHHLLFSPLNTTVSKYRNLCGTANKFAFLR